MFPVGDCDLPVGAGCVCTCTRHLLAEQFSGCFAALDSQRGESNFCCERGGIVVMQTEVPVLAYFGLKAKVTEAEKLISS